MRIIEVADIDKGTIIDALNSEFNDFEDALQNYAAQRKKGITVIVTRNSKDYKTSQLSIMSPETYLKALK